MCQISLVLILTNDKLVGEFFYTGQKIQSCNFVNKTSSYHMLIWHDVFLTEDKWVHTRKCFFSHDFRTFLPTLWRQILACNLVKKKLIKMHMIIQIDPIFYYWWPLKFTFRYHLYFLIPFSFYLRLKLENQNIHVSAKSRAWYPKLQLVSKNLLARIVDHAWKCT